MTTNFFFFFFLVMHVSYLFWAFVKAQCVVESLKSYLSGHFRLNFLFSMWVILLSVSLVCVRAARLCFTYVLMIFFFQTVTSFSLCRWFYMHNMWLIHVCQHIKHLHTYACVCTPTRCLLTFRWLYLLRGPKTVTAISKYFNYHYLWHFPDLKFISYQVSYRKDIL